MAQEDEVRLGLAEYLTGLQAELGRARAQAASHELEFSADGVTLELSISYTLTRSAESPSGLQPQFWVLGTESTEDALFERGNVQQLTVRLTPQPALESAEESREVSPSALPHARFRTAS
jgi:hypothetical protein